MSRAEVALVLQSLDVPDGSWLDLTIPGSEPEVRLCRLHADPVSRASVSLVRFPPGWRRPGAGHYLPAEEFVVLEGSIDVVGTHRAGDYVYLPPRTVRTDTRSDEGALVIAWFSGVPEWVAGEPTVAAPQDPVALDARGVLRADAPEVPGEYAVLADGLSGPLHHDADVLDLEARLWGWLPAGTPPPTGHAPLHVRSWG
jgi:ChrR Cupin-like domain